jgi:anti-anti-sigma factor
MEIREERDGQAVVVAPVGRVDSGTARELEKALLGRVAAGDRRLVVDLQGVEYISSAGLRVLLLGANALRPVGGSLVLCAMRESVREVFELAGFTDIFTTFGSREQALARAGPEG